MTQTIAKLLTATEIALHNAMTDEQINPRLTAYGYGVPELEIGQALYRQAAEQQRGVAARYGRQFAATDAFQQLWQQARRTLNHHRRLARVAFRNERDARRQLGLSGRPGRSFAGWVEMAALFYEHSLHDKVILTRLAQFGLTSEQLEAGQQDVKSLVVEKGNQRRQVGSARAITQERNQTLRALRRWLRDFVDVTRIALADDPSALAKLGPLVAGSKRRGIALDEPLDESPDHDTDGLELHAWAEDAEATEGIAA